jgi:hypothetical protein
LEAVRRGLFATSKERAHHAINDPVHVKRGEIEPQKVSQGSRNRHMVNHNWDQANLALDAPDGGGIQLISDPGLLDAIA